MMKVAIIALILSIAALGLGSFATFASLNNDETSLIAEPGWSAAECERADGSLDDLELSCLRGNCDAYADMLQAIAENCE